MSLYEVEFKDIKIKYIKGDLEENKININQEKMN